MYQDTRPEHSSAYSTFSASVDVRAPLCWPCALARYVLKTDDDTFVRMDRVLSELVRTRGLGDRQLSASRDECLYWGNRNQLHVSLTELPSTNKW